MLLVCPHMVDARTNFAWSIGGRRDFSEASWSLSMFELEIATKDRFQQDNGLGWLAELVQTHDVVQSDAVEVGSCGIAGRFHVVKSGHTGQIWVRCPNFWVRGHDDKPVCWHGCCWLGEVPRSVLQQQQRLRKDLRLQLQHGPQTKR